MASQPHLVVKPFCYTEFQLLKTESLGIGSYGAVYKARCDNLPCAAKILHPTLFQTNDPGSKRIVQRFDQECVFLSSIRHPHIVQYLGVATDPESGLPVLLMELMDENLTKFLEQSQQPLPYHIQINLCLDIALALAFLHSNGIIHRDLSSNNVLLIAGSRAKVTDFGMSRIASIYPPMTPLTQCPGTQAYMPPEALQFPPQYGQKLDCFSFGVVGIQIMTRIFPDPDPPEEIFEDPRSPTGTIKMPVSELKRRKNHIALIDPNNPLLAVTLDLLKDKDYKRPSSHEISSRLSALKEAPQYTLSKQQMTDKRKSIEVGERYMREKYGNQVERLQQQLKAKEQRLVQKDKLLLDSRMEGMRYKEELEETTRELKAQMKRKDAILLEDQGEIVQLKSALDLTTRNLKEKEHAYRELKDQFSKLKLASDQATRQIRHMQQTIDEKEKQLKETLHLLQKLQKDNKRHAVVFDGATVVGNTKPIPGPRKRGFTLATSPSDQRNFPPTPSVDSTEYRYSCPPESVALIHPTPEPVPNCDDTVKQDHHNRTWPEQELQAHLLRPNLPTTKPVPKQRKKDRYPSKLAISPPSLRKARSETHLNVVAAKEDQEEVVRFWWCSKCPYTVPDSCKRCPMCQTPRKVV